MTLLFASQNHYRIGLPNITTISQVKCIVWFQSLRKYVTKVNVNFFNKNECKCTNCTKLWVHVWKTHTKVFSEWQFRFCTCFCVVLCVCLCTGHVVMVLLNLTWTSLQFILLYERQYCAYLNYQFRLSSVSIYATWFWEMQNFIFVKNVEHFSQ